MSSDEKSASALQRTGSPEPVVVPATSPSSGHKAQTAIQVLSTFIVFFNTWGLLLTLGAFQTYYELVLLPDKSSSTISWIATTCAFLVLSAGIITGPLYDHGLYKTLLVGGTLLQVFGMMMLSLSTQYYQLFLSQAICVGLGAGAAFTPSVAAAAASLPHPATRAKAMGLMACGSSIGGIIYPLMFRYLEPQIGFAWTVRSIAFVMLGLYLVAYLALAGHQQKVPTVRRFFDPTSLTDAPWMVLCAASVLSATAYYIPLLYLPIITEIKVPSLRQDTVLDLLAVLNAASAVGRLLAGVIAAAIGPTETCTIFLTFGFTLLFCWTAVSTLAGTTAWCVFWGMISGVLVSVPGAFIPLFCPSVSVLGTRNGMYWISIGIGMLIGSPIGGAIYNLRSADGAGLWRLQVFAGCCQLGAAVLTIYPVMHVRRRSASK